MRRFKLFTLEKAYLSLMMQPPIKKIAIGLIRILVTSAIDQALVKAEIRRDCSFVLRSAAIRSLHDIVTVFGLGADLISPYYMFMTVLDESTKPLINLYSALTKGLGKSNFHNRNP